MTMEMILALGILVLMIVLIMSDKMPFGAPPLLACLLLVVSGLSTVQQAFAGFVNPSVVMIAGFMVVMAALQKTRLISNVKSAMISLVNKRQLPQLWAVVSHCYAGCQSCRHRSDRLLRANSVAGIHHSVQ